ncbi:hypothetical protein I3842_06G084200 [Carya illinoinensis]|uniref:Protein FAR1-RELATED SEQUENCE n=1 Tax=Carya illinoinensis TaxID=32201 RepID=A0A922JIA2_CARIL|nr:hypothetical protein I3842_06G084200 [Carya illinoinensis]
MPALRPTIPYTSFNNPEELIRFEETPQRLSESSTVRNSTKSEKNIGETTSDINKDVEGTNEVSGDDERVDEPKSSMEFATEKELLAYYKRYAKQAAFGVRTQRTKREVDESVKYVTIGCACGGKYYPSSSNVARPRPTIKADYKPKVNSHLVSGVWVLTIVEIAHNHTVSPQKSRFFRSHKCLDEYSQMMLDLNDRVGIRMNKNFNSLVVEARGFEYLEFAKKDCQNFIDKARHLRLGKGGGEAISDYFERMREINDGFISVMDVDDEFRHMSISDTTYLTNRYGMPFASFVSVNHHGQSILLGAGLISSEDTSTFVWLFRVWLKCIKDRAMKAVIAIIFPNSHHRYCLWHIMWKLSEKLGSHSQFNLGLRTSIQSALYDSQTWAKFEEKWGKLLQKYELGSNAWLQGLYDESVFWAGMSTTQRYKSMNAFFDEFVHSGTMLKEFVDRFDNALRKKVEVEAIAGFNSSNQTIPSVSSFAIEKQFQSVYTNAKFKEVQREVLWMILCNCTLVSTQGCISTYDVLDEISIDDHVKMVHYLVYYNEEECEVKCMCALFEMRGIIYRHVFRVCHMKKLNVLPENKYWINGERI